jgi:hypothetical protein
VEVKDTNDSKIIKTDTKCVTTKLTVKSELNFIELTKASVEYIKERIDDIEKPNYIRSKNDKNDTSYCSIVAITDDGYGTTNIGDYSAAVVTGDYSAAENSGDNSISASTGYCSAVIIKAGISSAAVNTGNNSATANTGPYSVAASTGNTSIAANISPYSAATNTGDHSVSANSGDYSAATSTGDYSAATNAGKRSIAVNAGANSAATITGNHSIAANSGNYSAAITKGKNSVAAAFGPNSIAKGDIDNWIILSEWEKNEECVKFIDAYILKDIKSFKVDGISILPDTFYKLVDGQPVVVEKEELKKYNY